MSLSLLLGGFSMVHASGSGIGFPIVTRYAGPAISGNGEFWSEVQTTDQVLHFGGTAMMSFDGERWASHPMPVGYGVRGLDVGSDGRIWAAAIGEMGWFDRANGVTSFHSLLPSLPPAHAKPGNLWHAFAQGTGAVFLSDDHIFRWDGAKFETWEMPGTRHLRGFRAGQSLFVQHRPTGLYEMTSAGPVISIPARELGDSALVFVERIGSSWTFINGHGIYRRTGGRLQRIDGPASDYLSQHVLASAVRLPDNRIAVSTTDDGIVLVDAEGNLDARLTKTSGIGEGYIGSLMVDRQGALWATSKSAIYRISLHGASTVFDARARLASQQITKIAKDDLGMLFLTHDALYRVAPNSETVSVGSLTGSPFIDLQTSRRGLLVGGRRSLDLVTADATRRIYATQNDVSCIMPLRDGRHLFVDGRNIVGITPDGSARVVVENIPDYVTSVGETDAGEIWIGTYSNGVFVAKPADNLPVHARLLSSHTGLVFTRGQSRVAVARAGTVLIFNDSGAWFGGPGNQHFERVENFPGSYVVPINADTDAAGSVWAVTETPDHLHRTVGRISLKNGRAIWEPHSVEGLSAVGIPRCVFVENADQTSVLWIGGTEGVLRDTAARGPSTVQPSAPLLFVSAKTSAGEATPITGTLPYSTPSIEFVFAEPDFARRSLLRLETRIDGIDRDWIAAGADSRRELTALRDGQYTFRVRAVAETGVASPATSVSFAVAPPWWRTAPALLGVVFALGPFGYGLYRLRLQALRRRTAELEAKVRQRTEQLEQANAAKTQFVANVSHDIRNPLNGIVGLALALEDTRLDTRQREIVATLRECTAYLSTLVDDVLDFASIEAGRVELRPGPFVPAELLRSIVTTTKTDTAESGARIVVDADPALPAVLSGDAGRIQQILVNYVSNALKYAGGTIHLTATIPIGLADEVEFAVSDEGPGISPAEQATLFTKFTRLSAARQHEIPGSGLGLASCRLLADIMGGSVGVVSEPGHGARFFLRLPLTPADAPLPPAAGELPHTTVLLVEDTDYNAMAATAVLKRLGLTAERARTGAEALQLFAAKRFNLVLLDRNLPDMDGTEIARKMREFPTDGLPAMLLAVTAFCTEEDRQLCLDAGMDAFIGKPLTPEKLRKVLLAAGKRMLAAATLETTADPAPATKLDTSMLRYISDGTDEGLNVQVERFLATLAEYEAQLARAVVTRDPREFTNAAHGILGQARMVGAHNLASAASALQKAAQAEDLASCDEIRPRVVTEIRALTAALRYRRSGAPTA